MIPPVLHTILLAESALEPVPPELQAEPAIMEEARRAKTTPGKLLLDASRHLPLMRKHLKDWSKRGRPDIAHFCALLALDSRLNQERGVRFLVHTRNDEVIVFAPDVRLPRVYNRFCGLVQDLFEKRRIEHEGKTLLFLEKKTLRQLLVELAEENEILVLDQTGERKTIPDLSELAGRQSACFVIGGFPHGAFSSPELAKLPKFSISSKELCTWAVLTDVLAACEIASDEEKQ